LYAGRAGAVVAEDMILSGRIFTADDMKRIGLVHIVSEPGEGLMAARNYIRENGRRHAGMQAFFRATWEVDGIPFNELERVVGVWAETRLSLDERQLKIMQRLVSAQDRLYGAAVT